MVLTIDALHVAVAEENVAYTVNTGQYRFFAVMGADGGNGDGVIALTETRLSVDPVDTALTRTTDTVAQEISYRTREFD